MLLLANGSKERGQQFSLGVHAELSIYGDEVVADGAGAEEHRAGDFGGTLPSDKPGHYFALAGR